MKKIDPVNYNFSNVRLFSPAQLKQHYSLYINYINSYNQAISNLQSEGIFSNCNQNYSQIRCAQKAQSFCLDAIKLHELYFENLTGKNTQPYGKIVDIINDNFTSYEKFLDKFKCIGKSMRGWVIFCYDIFMDEYYIYGQDSHDDGVILYTTPLIVLDVYEHAYMIDYGVDRSAYIDSFFDNLDFEVINKRLE